MFEQCALRFAADWLRQLPVRAQEVGGVMLGDEAYLARCRPGRVDDEMRFDQRLRRERRGKRLPCFILADNADEEATRAERSNIARHIAGAPDAALAALHGDDRRRRLG